MSRESRIPVGPRISTRRLSVAAPPVSAESMWSQKESRTRPAADGIATAWDSESVCAVPYPPSQAYHAPDRGCRCVDRVTTAGVTVHADPPDSNPGSARSWLPDGFDTVTVTGAPDQARPPSSTAFDTTVCGLSAAVRVSHRSEAEGPEIAPRSVLFM